MKGRDLERELGDLTLMARPSLREPGTVHRASRRAVAHFILTAIPGVDAAIAPLYRRVSEAGQGSDVLRVTHSTDAQSGGGFRPV